jgi:hypothetical protein
LAIVEEQAYRLRTLLSVDDVVEGLREYLIEAGEWDRTYWIFTSGEHLPFCVCLCLRISQPLRWSLI